MMNPDKQKSSQYPDASLSLARQQGFVLVLVLVLLAVLTLIGISSMNSSNMELKATANSRQHQIAFNAVSSLIEYAISGQTDVIVDFQTVPSAAQAVPYTMTGADSLVAIISYAGCASSVGSSLEEGKGFKSNFFNAAGSGTNGSGTAASSQVQGVRFPAAACSK